MARRPLLAATATVAGILAALAPQAGAATAVAGQEGAAPPPADGSDVPRTPIPRSVGTRRAYPYRLSIGSIPPGVDAGRYQLLVRVAATRWGLRFVGRTRRTPRSGDGSDMVGFATRLPRGALGVTEIRAVRVYRREASGRTRFLRERVVERDLLLAYGAPWHAGPGVPPSDRLDLQTVIIHELGHYAGNDHVPDCVNSPMWAGLRAGEWWWSRADWFQLGCPEAPGVPAPAADLARGTRAAGRADAAVGGPRRSLLVRHTVRRVVLR